MNQNKSNHCQVTSEPNVAKSQSGDVVNYRSEDGAVEIVTKVTTARRHPQHSYPVVCLLLRPRPGSRVQTLTDGSGGLDVLLNHPEVAAHVHALVKADPKCAGYRVPNIPAKSAARKKYWDKINQERQESRSK